MTLGCSKADVLRSPDGRHHAKRVRGTIAVGDLEDERDRQLWLAGRGIAAPRVVDWWADDGGAVLVSTTVPGVPASDVTAADAERAARSIGAMLADLHAASAECPFDRRLAVTVELASAAVVAGRVDLEDLDAPRSGRTGVSLLAELQDRAAGRGEDVVLCHGDASLPNLFLDPVTFAPSGFVDVGRLGLADRYLDLALAVRSMDDERNPGYHDGLRTAFWDGYGAPTPELDRDAVDFYQLLDEFF